MMMKMGILKKSLQKMKINIEQEIAIKRRKAAPLSRLVELPATD
jgi:hypothetical protein